MGKVYFHSGLMLATVFLPLCFTCHLLKRYLFILFGCPGAIYLVVAWRSFSGGMWDLFS